MGGSLPRGRSAQRALGLDPHGGRPSPAHPDRPAPGLSLRRRPRGHRPPRLDTVATLMRVPVLFLFYEIAVLPMYLLIGIWGSSGEIRPQGIFGWALRRTGVGTKEYAAMKLTLYLLFGSAFILVGILALYVAAGSSSFSFLEMEGIQFDRGLQSWVFLAFYVGFGILAGIWPLHTWSPDCHASAPTAVSMLHAGVLMKLGAYGVVRLGLGLLPDGTQEWVWLVGAIACVNIGD